MTRDAVLVLQCLFSTLWKLFTRWHIPGTNVSPAVAMFGILFTVMMFRFISGVLGLWDKDTVHTVQDFFEGRGSKK